MKRSDSNVGTHGRDGRFRKGNPGGPGNPRLRALADVQAAIGAAFTPADVVRVLKALLRRAVRGDMAAASVFLSRLCGPPGRRVDLPALAKATDTPARLRVILEGVADGRLDVETACRLGDFVRPRVDPFEAELDAETVGDEFFL